MATQSPFMTHRAKVLGHYSTAYWLRDVVMALHSGGTHPVGLSRLTTTDEAHFTAFKQMVDHYRRVGENDPALHTLVSDIEARCEEERSAEERSDRLYAWNAEARGHLRTLGRPSDVVDDRYDWFEHRFDLGRTPVEAVAEFAALE